MAKCERYVGMGDIADLICNSDSEEECVSDDSDTEAAAELSEDFDNSVLTDQLWRDSGSEDRAKIHNFSAPKPGVNCHAATHISVDSSPLDCF